VARKALWNSQAAAVTRKLIDEFRPNLLHVHKLYNQLSVAPVVVASGANIPVVQTLHDCEFISASPFDHRGRWLDRDEVTLSYRLLNSAAFLVRRYVHRPRVSAWISVSRYVAERHATRGIVSTVLPNFVTGIDGEPNPGFDERRGDPGERGPGRLGARRGRTRALQRSPCVQMVVDVRDRRPARVNPGPQPKSTTVSPGPTTAELAGVHLAEGRRERLVVARVGGRLRAAIAGRDPGT
jgi:hypothetical protein